VIARIVPAIEPSGIKENVFIALSSPLSRMDASTSPSGAEPSNGTKILLYIRNLLERKVRNMAGVNSGALAKNLLASCTSY
jgi:hypothetical protein